MQEAHTQEFNKFLIEEGQQGQQAIVVRLRVLLWVPCAVLEVLLYVS
jgi:hypothetical protein